MKELSICLCALILIGLIGGFILADAENKGLFPIRIRVEDSESQDIWYAVDEMRRELTEFEKSLLEK